MSDTEDVLVNPEAEETTETVETAQTEAETTSNTPEIAEDTAIDNDDLLSNENLDKVEEYFRLKDSLRVLRNDIKDIKLQQPEVQEMEELQKKVKKLREDIKENEEVKIMTEKMAIVKERMDLLKELIRIELLDSAQEEVKRNGRKLKIVTILKEMKDNENDKKGKKKQFFRN